jgi:hypothetical protein
VNLRRRNLLGALAAAPFAACNAANVRHAPGDYVRSVLWAGSTVAPAQFMGMHIGYPASGAAAPTYGFSYFRCHDGTPKYFDINTSAGVYNWAQLDPIIDYHYGRGRRIIYTIYGTPQWNAAVGAGTLGLYGRAGEGSPPASYVQFEDFVNKLVARYVARGTPLHAIETWNEGPLNGVISASSFFWGTAADMARMARSVKIAARAAQPSIVVLGPALDSTAALTIFLNASDGSAGFGRDHLDDGAGGKIISFHPYNMLLPDGSGSVTEARYASPAAMDAAVNSALAAGGLTAATTVKHASEFALTWDINDVALARYNDEFKAAYVGRISFWLAALGWRSAMWYLHDNAMFGNPSTSPRVSDMLDQCNAVIPGSTLAKIELMASQRFKNSFANGNTFFV